MSRLLEDHHHSSYRGSPLCPDQVFVWEEAPRLGEAGQEGGTMPRMRDGCQCPGGPPASLTRSPRARSCPSCKCKASLRSGDGGEGSEKRADDFVFRERAGYHSSPVRNRARYLADARRTLSDGLLRRVGRMSTDDAREALMTLPGVGEKVADCILLFAYGRGHAFPVDTWIRKVMIRLFFRGRRVPDREIRAFAADRWGEFAGYAQQVLFTWGRAAVRGPRPGPAS